MSTLQSSDLEHVVHPFAVWRGLRERGIRVMVRGEGVYVWDEEGRRYLDGISGQWCVNIGHGRREIADAVAEQMARLAYSPIFHNASHPPVIELASALVERAPRGLTRVLFTNSGSEANETAFKLARCYWKAAGKSRKETIIARKGAYHGATIGAASASGIPELAHMFGPMAPGFVHANDLEAAILNEPDLIAALILEPIPGGGGVLVPKPDYINHLAEVCRRHDVLLILDEVITAFGRTGRLFAAEHWGIQPDMITLAKGMTSGYVPMGGVLVQGKIYDAIAQGAPPDFPFLHGFTTAGHPCATTAALVNLQILEREKLPDRAAKVGARLLQRLKALSNWPGVVEVRGIGLMVAVELRGDDTQQASYATVSGPAQSVAKRALAIGDLLVRAPGNNVIVAPPLVLTDDQADEIAAVLASAIDDEFMGQ